MENKVLQENIDHLSGYDKCLADKILMRDISKANISLTKTLKDEYNIIFNDVLIHDNKGAYEEARRIASKIKDEKNTIRIVYGLGMGYLADTLAQVLKESKIIIYEPNLDLLNFILSIARIDALFNKNVFICSDEKSLIGHIQKLADFDSKMTITFLPSYNKNDVMQIFSVAQKALGEISANKNTFLKKAPAAIKNTLANLKHILNNPSIEVLRDIYKGKTALCVSAGPSLEENIEILKNHQDKFVIFSLNNTLELLKKNNIEPDFIVDIETIDNQKQFKSINPCEYYFILEAFCNPKIAAFKTKKTFNYISQGNFLNPWVLECLNQKSNLKTFGTVSYTALSSAYLMGFKRIVLLGCDLAYKNGMCYSKGSQYQNLRCVLREGKYVIEADDFDAFVEALRPSYLSLDKARRDAKKYLEYLNKNIYTVKSQTQELIPTQTGYALFIEYFKNFALQAKDAELINSSEGGAQIDGFKNLPLLEVIKDLEPIEKLDLTSFEASFNKDIAREKIENVLNKLLGLNSLFEEIIPLAKKLISELEIKKVFTQNALKLAKKQKELLKKILGYKDFDIAVSLIYSFLDILQRDYLSNIEDIKLLNKKFIEANSTLKYMIKELTNCKPFIL